MRRLLNIWLIAALIFITASSGCSITSVSNRQSNSQNHELNAFLNKTAHLSSSTEEKAILNGLLWMSRFVEEDKNFNFIFSDYVLMLNELTLRNPESPVARSAETMMKDAFARASKQLPQIFPKDCAGKWDFLSILFILYKWELPKDPFVDFYNNYYQDDIEIGYEHMFKEALKTSNYDILGDILIDTSFPYFFNKEFVNAEIKLQPVPFEDYMQRVTNLKYVSTTNTTLYSDMNYYATHVIFVANNYGEDPLPNSVLIKQTQKYIEQEFLSVRHTVKDDLEIIAEFVHCMKIFGHGNKPEVQEAISHLLSLQHNNGCWGTENDFKGDPYDIFHPTWTVITALHY